MGFWLTANKQYLQTSDKDRVASSGATIYHYGWVKPPAFLLAKFRYQFARHHGDKLGDKETGILARDDYEFEDCETMKHFTGTHPVVMTDRVSQYPALKSRRNRWLNPGSYRAILQRGFRR